MVGYGDAVCSKLSLFVTTISSRQNWLAKKSGGVQIATINACFVLRVGTTEVHFFPAYLELRSLYLEIFVEFIHMQCDYVNSDVGHNGCKGLSTNSAH